jgi:hypothetical protein
MGNIHPFMGNPQNPSSDTTDTLVHSFQLDSSTDYCSFPPCYPGKQAMFHLPNSFPENLATFIPYEECVRVIEDINQILRNTGFPNHQFNPAFLMTIGSTFLCFFLMMYLIWTGLIWTYGAPLLFGIFVPMITYSVLTKVQSVRRQNNLLKFLREWNEKASNGVRLSLGGTGHTRWGIPWGSETGENHVFFFLSTHDPTGTMIKGFLQVFVNYQDRSSWCQRTGVPFVAPVPLSRPANPGQDGGVTVQVPAGYALVPQAAVDQPPTYSQSKNM